MSRKVSRVELVAFLMALKGATFATFKFNTDARAKKTGNPFGTIRKETTVNGQLNFHYDNAVVNRLAKEGKGPEVFEQGTSWHHPIKRADGSLTPFASKKGEAEPSYIRFRLLQQIAGPDFFDTLGRPLAAEVVKPFLPKPSSYDNQGTEDPVIFLTYGLDAVRELTADGETLEVVS